MDKEYREFIGVDSLYYALVTADTEAAYTAGTPEYLAPVADIGNDTPVNNTTTYYDNVPMNNYSSEGATTVTVVVSGISPQKAAELLGKYYNEATGAVYDDGVPNPPDVALSFRYKKGADDYRYYQYLKGKFTGGTEEATTVKDGIEVKTYQLTFTAFVTTHKWTVNSVSKGLKRIFAETTDTNFTKAASWFTEVQTPDTLSAA